MYFSKVSTHISIAYFSYSIFLYFKTISKLRSLSILSLRLQKSEENYHDFKALTVTMHSHDCKYSAFLLNSLRRSPLFGRTLFRGGVSQYFSK